MEILENKFTKDKVYKTILENGLKVFILPKTTTKKKLCMFGTFYGSIDNYIKEDNERVNITEGVAHFLEHKLFEQENENIMEKFSQVGVDPNAYTTFDHTVYYFETVNDMKKPLEYLIRMISSPYFTDENVEKEKGIISQEIAMYNDNPDYQSSMISMKNIYLNNPVRNDIAGTDESIAKIDKELLYKVYEQYYRLNNMFLLVIGDVKVEETLKEIENNINKYYTKEEKETVEYTYVEEPIGKVKNKYIEKELQVSIPKICISYKLKPLVEKENIKRELAINIIEEIYFGRLSKFYERYYKLNYINEPLSVSHEDGRSYSYVSISCNCKNTEKMQKIILEYIEDIKNSKVDSKLLKVIKNKLIGTMIYESEDNEELAYEIIKSEINNSNIFEEGNILETIDESYIESIIKEIFKNKYNLTVIKRALK